MEANSPGMRKYLREERMKENPDMERKKQKRIFNRLVHGLMIQCSKYYADGMVKEGRKKDLFEPPDYKNGMYALDEIKLSYAEALSSSVCTPGPRDNRAREKTRITKTRPKWIRDLKHETSIDPDHQEGEATKENKTWPEKEARKRNKKIKRIEEETKEGPEQENQKNPAQKEDTTGSKPKIRNQENPTLKSRMSLTLNSKTKTTDLKSSSNNTGIDHKSKGIIYPTLNGRTCLTLNSKTKTTDPKSDSKNTGIDHKSKGI